MPSRPSRQVEELLSKARSLDPEEQWRLIQTLAGTLEQTEGFDVEYDGENEITFARIPSYEFTLLLRIEGDRDLEELGEQLARLAVREIVGVNDAEFKEWDNA